MSGFQVHIGKGVLTPGDLADVLVAMYPAALKSKASYGKKGGVVIIDSASFRASDLEKAAFTTDDPIHEAGRSHAQFVPVAITQMVKDSLADSGLDNKSIVRCKNMFALGMIYWMFEQSVEHTEAFFDIKFCKNPAIASANKMVLRAGYNYAANVHTLTTHFKIAIFTIKKKKYNSIEAAFLLMSSGTIFPLGAIVGYL